VLQQKVAGLQRQNQKLGSLTTSLRDLVAALPFDSGLPAFTRQVSRQAVQSAVTITSVTVGSISPVNGTAAGGTSTSGTGSATGKVFAIPITLISTGSAAHQFAFLKAIQVDGPRRALVSSTQLAPGGSEGTSVKGASTMTTQLTVFTTPLSSLQQAELEKLLSGNVSTN